MSNTQQASLNTLKPLKLQNYIIKQKPPILKLDVTKAFDQLSEQEKLYAHFISKACWAGYEIVLQQSSLESQVIFNMITSVGDLEKSKSHPKYNDFMNFVINFLSNGGNYTGFGDNKILPNMSITEFEEIINLSHNDECKKLFHECKQKLYDTSKLDLDFGNTGYYSDNVTKEDVEFVQEFMKEKNINAYNTTLFKEEQANEMIEYTLKIASITPDIKKYVYIFKNKTINVEYGNFSDKLQRVHQNLSEALKYVANDNQKNMLINYLKFLETGNIDDHKESQKYWIKDKQPHIECNLGFIESYRDPYKVRGEWEGFVAVVNKEMSKKFQVLVDNSEQFLKLLPHNNIEGQLNPIFEKDEFMKPDFTSLDVLSFSSSGIPIGINIPNYNDIRQTLGFKNVSLGNVISSRNQETPDFLNDDDVQLMKKYGLDALEMQVGLHEMLGHGSGKLLTASSGSLNYNRDDLKAWIEKYDWIKPTHYKEGESYRTVFTDISSSFEECRAECVALHLSVYDEVLKIFCESHMCDDILYTNWLHMVHSGIKGLQSYSPDSSKWTQAHSQARFTILQVLLEVKDFVTITHGIQNDKPYFTVTINRDLIKTTAYQAISDFLFKIQVYRSTADVQAARVMYDKYTTVSDEFLKIREIVMERKKPRPVYVQSNTDIVNDKVTLKDYELTPEGVVQSYLDRI
jgi:dipeptidyl-peptidase-3